MRRWKLTAVAMGMAALCLMAWQGSHPTHTPEPVQEIQRSTADPDHALHPLAVPAKNSEPEHATAVQPCVARREPQRPRSTPKRDPFGNAIKGPIEYEYGEDGTRFARARLARAGDRIHGRPISGISLHRETLLDEDLPESEDWVEEGPEYDALLDRLEIPADGIVHAWGESVDGVEGVSIMVVPAD